MERFRHAAQMEHIHLRQTAIPQSATIVDASQFTVDQYSLQLMQTYSGDQSLIPVSVSADGNCFFQCPVSCIVWY